MVKENRTSSFPVSLQNGGFNLQIRYKFNHEKNFSMLLRTMRIYNIFEKKKSVSTFLFATHCEDILE